MLKFNKPPYEWQAKRTSWGGVHWQARSEKGDTHIYDRTYLAESLESDLADKYGQRFAAKVAKAVNASMDDAWVGNRR